MLRTPESEPQWDKIPHFISNNLDPFDVFNTSDLFLLAIFDWE